MVETRVFCDRCRAPILEGRSVLRVEAGPLRARLEVLDLCGDCAELLQGWLAAEHAPAPVLGATGREG